MQVVSDLYKELLAGEYRVETRLAIETETGELITEENELINMSLKAKLYPGNSPSVGNCVSAQLDVEMLKPDVNIPKNAKMIPYTRLTDGDRYSEWLTSGTYYIDTRKETGGTGRKQLTIRAYDAMLKADQDYPETKLDWPAKDIDVVNEICDFLDIPVSSGWVADTLTKGYLVEYPGQYSCREVLGYIAAMYGGNFMLFESGSLVFIPLWRNTWGDKIRKTDVTKKMVRFSNAEEQLRYTRVELIVNEDTTYYSGTVKGKTLTVECPWGTQRMAQDISLQFERSVHKYKPYKVDVVLFNPASERSDGIVVNGINYPIHDMEVTFGPNYRATLAAPWEEVLEHEYKYERKKDRKIRRQLRSLTTELTVQAGLIQGEIIDRINENDLLESQITQQATEISAKVSKTGGDSSSFGWDLTASSWTLKSAGTTVLSATASGVEITGKITATSGEIGGFTIKEGYLSTRGQTWLGEENGIYIGPSGIQLGPNFRVDRWGELYAYSGTFTGTVYAGSIAYDEEGSAGTFSGWGLEQFTVGGWWGNDRIDTDTLATNNFVEGVNESLANADWAAGVLSGAESAEWLGALTVSTETLDVSETMYFGGYQLYLGSFPDRNGTIQRCVQWYA